MHHTVQEHFSVDVRHAEHLFSDPRDINLSAAKEQEEKFNVSMLKENIEAVMKKLTCQNNLGRSTMDYLQDDLLKFDNLQTALIGQIMQSDAKILDAIK